MRTRLTFAVSTLLVLFALGPEGSARAQRTPPLRSRARAVEVKTRARLFHQVRRRYTAGLERRIGKRFQPLPAGWIEHGPIWTSAGSLYFDAGDYSHMGVFELRLRPGWIIVPRDTLALDPETGASSPLFDGWRALPGEAGPRIPNTFSRRLRLRLQGEEMPDHSEFYRSLGIAGFFVEDERGSRKRAFVFLHDLGAEVRLVRAGSR